MEQKQQKNVSAVIVLIIAVLVVFIAFIFFKKWHQVKITDSQEKEKVKYSEEIKKLQEDIKELKEEVELQKDHIIPSEEVEAVFKKEAPAVNDCERVTANVNGFFAYLDQDGSRKMKARAVYLDTIKRLSDNRPVISDNSAEVLALIRSMSHFYRILGKENLSYIKDLVTKDAEILEPAMDSFFDWFTLAQKCHLKTSEVPSIEMLYNYSCFFLNTLSGKSYMLRRSSKIRILTTYYSTLIIDRANDEGKNVLGYDIRSNIKLLQDDIRSHGKLLYKKKYLERLGEILKKYPEQIEQ